MTIRCTHCGIIRGHHVAPTCNPPFEVRAHNFEEDDLALNPVPPRAKLRAIDTGELGPIRVPTPSYRQTQARIVREALEAVASTEIDRMVAAHMTELARYGSTETLAYLARLLKG